MQTSFLESQHQDQLLFEGEWMKNVFVAIISGFILAGTSFSSAKGSELSITKAISGNEAGALMDTMELSGVTPSLDQQGRSILRAQSISCKSPVTRNPRANCIISQEDKALRVPSAEAQGLNSLLLEHGGKKSPGRIGIILAEVETIRCTRDADNSLCTFATSLRTRVSGVVYPNSGNANLRALGFR
jgi:hypothetical protein